MKPSTKIALESLQKALELVGTKKVRQGLMLCGSGKFIDVCLSIGHREWADGVATFSIYLQAYWHEVEAEYSEIIGEKYKKFQNPTRSMSIAFSPALNYRAEINEFETSTRAAEWWKASGKALLEGFSAHEQLFDDSLRALSDNSFFSYPEKVYLMSRKIFPDMPAKESVETVESMLLRDWDRTRFKALCIKNNFLQG